MINVDDEYRYRFQFSQDEVKRFAEVTGDDNPIHLDAEYAAKSVFKQPIMHGFLCGSVFSKVFGTLFPGVGTIYLKQSLEFLRAMHVDKPYEAVFTVYEINRKKHIALIRTEIYELETPRKKIMIRGEAEIQHPEKV